MDNNPFVELVSALSGLSECMQKLDDATVKNGMALSGVSDEEMQESFSKLPSGFFKLIGTNSINDIKSLESPAEILNSLAKTNTSPVNESKWNKLLGILNNKKILTNEEFDNLKD